MVRWTACRLGLLVLLLVAAPAAAVEPLDAVPLAWSPEAEGLPAVGRLPGPVSVAAFSDGRRSPSVIGQNEEDRVEGVIRRVLTRDDVARWVGERVQALLAEHGGQPREGAPRLEGRVERFFVTETNRYRAEVSLALTLRGADGAVLWQGTVSGDSDHFGRSYKAGNYQQALSTALLRAVHALLADPGFRRALG